MKILVVSVDNIDNYPPVISLCETLVGLGHNVTVLSRNCTELPVELRSNNLLVSVDLGIRPEGRARIVDDIAVESKVKKYCREHVSAFDIVWTTTDYAARACGNTLLGVRHVMQLMELAEYVPLFSRRDMPLHSSVVPELARRAYRVVVPEYNRAFIQQAWWKLKRTPAVLPNKSVLNQSVDYSNSESDIQSQFELEDRRILLYQGVFTVDRDFSQIVSAMDDLGNDYALYLMGIRDSDRARLESLCNGHSNVVLIPFIPAPRHLVYTKHGHIGLLPYKPSYGRESPLNALYCAPNKVWEYSRFGLPMIGSDVPGLTSLFNRERMGVTCDIDNSSAFVDAVLKIDSDYDKYSRRSRAYFESVATAAIVQQILKGE